MVDVAKGEIEEIGMDATLDDVEDLPGFNIPLTGAYVCLIRDTDFNKAVNEKSAINFEFEVQEVVECTEEPDDGETPTKAGDIFSAFFYKNNKFALDNFKKTLAKTLSERLGTKVIREIVEQAKGMQVMIVIKRKKDKKDSDKWRMNIKRIAVV